MSSAHGDHMPSFCPLMKTWIPYNNNTKCPYSLCARLSVTPRFLELLWNRGMTDPVLINNYLSPAASNLTFPDKWPLVPQAARLVADALLAGKKLAVWGDYDVDGITATALVLDILEFHGFSPLHHLPDRQREGYGLNIPGIENLAGLGCETLLTVDCGISDILPVKRARELGIQVIISDHHLPPPVLPAADGIVNPRMQDAGDWPCPNLAGVGVAFFLMAQVNRLLEPHSGKRFRMDDVLDLVALGTLADVMDVSGENRLLIRGGLLALQQPARPGLATLKAVSHIDSSTEMSSEQAVFQLTPRLNAAGRMGSPELSLELLRAKDLKEAEILAEKLNACNRERKEEQQKIFLEASQQAREFLELGDVSGLVLYKADWHAGIVGIVAAKIAEESGLPVIVACRDGGDLKGSGRSVKGLDLHAALKECGEILKGFGGHKMAAGIRLEAKNLELFRKSFNRAIARQKKSLVPEELYHDGFLDFAHAIDDTFLKELKLMEPFGAGNPDPVFISPELVVKSCSYMPFRTNSLTLQLEDSQSPEKYVLRCKLLGRASEFPANMVNGKIVVAYTPKLSYYNGIESIDILVKDWRIISRPE